MPCGSPGCAPRSLLRLTFKSPAAEGAPGDGRAQHLEVPLGRGAAQGRGRPRQCPPVRRARVALWRAGPSLDRARGLGPSTAEGTVCPRAWGARAVPRALRMQAGQRAASAPFSDITSPCSAKRPCLWAGIVAFSECPASPCFPFPLSKERGPSRGPRHWSGRTRPLPAGPFSPPHSLILLFSRELLLNLGYL